MYSAMPSMLRSMPDFAAKEICDLAREGDEAACMVLDRFGEYLGRAFSYIACTVDPEVFIIGGGVSRAGRILADAAMKYYPRYAFPVSAGTGAVMAQLGNDAGIYGAARMVLSK